MWPLQVTNIDNFTAPSVWSLISPWSLCNFVLILYGNDAKLSLSAMKSSKFAVLCSTGIFLLLHAFAALKYVKSFLTRSEFKSFFIGAVIVAAGVVGTGVVGLTYAGKSQPGHFIYL